MQAIFLPSSPGFCVELRANPLAPWKKTADGGPWRGRILETSRHKGTIGNPKH